MNKNYRNKHATLSDDSRTSRWGTTTSYGGAPTPNTATFHKSCLRRFIEMKSWQPVSLPTWLKCLNVEVIPFSEFMNSEIRITSTLRYFCQAARILFRKTSNERIGTLSGIAAAAPLDPPMTLILKSKLKISTLNLHDQKHNWQMTTGVYINRSKRNLTNFMTNILGA